MCVFQNPLKPQVRLPILVRIIVFCSGDIPDETEEELEKFVYDKGKWASITSKITTSLPDEKVKVLIIYNSTDNY